MNNDDSALMKTYSEKSTNPNGEGSRIKEFADAIIFPVREAMLVMDRQFRVVTATPRFYKLFNFIEQEIEGKSFPVLGFSSLNNLPLYDVLLNEINTKGNVRDLEVAFPHKPNEGSYLLVNASLLKRENEASLILLSFKKGNRNRGENQRELVKNFKKVLAHVPAMICIVRGPEHVFEVANEKYYQLLGNRDIIGKPVREAIPEVGNQGFFEVLDQVYKTGVPFIGSEIPIKINLDSTTQKDSILDFVYQPTLDKNGKVDGIFVHAIDVTEKVLARKKIEVSEKELRSVIDTVPAIIWITNERGESNYLNKNWYSYTGQAPEEAEGFGWLNAVHPDDRGRAEKAFLKAHSGKESYSVSFRLRNKNGDYRWTINHGSPKFNSNGAYEGMIGTVVDVHEEKLKEQLIKEKGHRLKSIVEEATVATALYTGKDMVIELANDAMIQVWGKDSSVQGKKLKDALPELEGQPFHSLLEEVYTTGKTYWGKEDKVGIIIDGELRYNYYNFTYKPLRNEKGEIYGILNMAIDVTDIVRSKNLLKESEFHFRQMADLMPEKVTNTDAEGNFVYFNQIWLDYTGLSSKELKSQGWSRLLHPDDKKEFENNWKRSLESGLDFEMEIRILSKNGNYKWHLSRAEAVKDENGAIKMWISTHTQIHKLKEEEKKKEDFLKMVSHELKTPVTSIKGYVQLLLSLLKNRNGGDISSLPLQPSLERIDHQIVRLTRLIAEMLDLSRLEENKLELQKTTFNINDLVDQTVQDINYTNTQHNIEVIHDYHCEVYADKDRIGQVLINFITNAIKYSPESRDVKVSIRREKEKFVEVAVRDRGIGIEKANQKKIFRRFYRIGGKSEETYAGFGIGLYLANEIIQRHKGYIKVNSEIGKGSEFSMVLSVASQKKNKRD